MIRVTFCEQDGSLTGFRLSGHSGFAAAGSDIVCAAATSSALMAANTVTEIIGDKADISVSEGVMELEVPSPSEKTKAVLSGLKLHLSELSKQYGARLQITEV